MIQKQNIFIFITVIFYSHFAKLVRNKILKKNCLIRFFDETKSCKNSIAKKVFVTTH